MPCFPPLSPPPHSAISQTRFGLWRFLGTQQSMNHLCNYQTLSSNINGEGTTVLPGTCRFLNQQEAAFGVGEQRRVGWLGTELSQKGVSLCCGQQHNACSRLLRPGKISYALWTNFTVCLEERGYLNSQSDFNRPNLLSNTCFCWLNFNRAFLPHRVSSGGEMEFASAILTWLLSTEGLEVSF